MQKWEDAQEEGDFTGSLWQTKSKCERTLAADGSLCAVSLRKLEKKRKKKTGPKGL